MKIPQFAWLVGSGLAATVLLAGTGCGKKSSTNAEGRVRVSLQTDWYAQGEHGGFYQAVATGLYREAGLEVTINQGGPGAFGTQKVATGQTQFSIGRSDEMIMAVQQGLPILIVGALMQHDPQALLLHEENPVNSFADLDGKSVMTTPGALWVRYAEIRYGISLNIIPINYGLAQFMSDKNFIQQCFITNEPYFVRKNGARPKTLLISETGFDPYRVIFTSHRFARENPEVVRAFVHASAQGWRDFLEGDNTAAKTLIQADNDKMDDEFIDYSVDSMNRNRLVAGDPAKGEYIGLLLRERMEEQVRALTEAGLLTVPMPLERFVSFDFMAPAP